MAVFHCRAQFSSSLTRHTAGNVTERPFTLLRLNIYLDWHLWLFLSSPSILKKKRNPRGTSLSVAVDTCFCHLPSTLPFWLLPITAIPILSCRKPGPPTFLPSSRAFCTCPLPPSHSPCPMDQFPQSLLLHKATQDLFIAIFIISLQTSSFLTFQMI